MDGLAYLPRSDYAGLSMASNEQSSVKAPISCTGIGVHSGLPVTVRLCPAPADHGIVFLRTDTGAQVAARHDAVVDTRLCTVLGGEDAASRVGTVEHLMAALAGVGIDNLVVEVDGPELPILDGSAEPWLFLLDCAGRTGLGVERRGIEILRTVRVQEGDAFAELRPATDGGPEGLQMNLAIEFAAAAIGAQALSFALDAGSFRRELSRARTFAQRREVEGLQQIGLARGGSLDNAIVVDGDSVLNPGGLRMRDEFVRHKMLDAVGDLALAGAPLHGRFVGSRSGHALNNQLLHAVFADPANWRFRAPAEALLAA
ncbi:MAG: UDP-3-O-acyl-N-acetylglucosamine deacetylase [Janthinobacterium lividum]